MLAHTQARWSRRGRAKCMCTSSVCRVSSLQRWLLNRYVSGLNSWYEQHCCFVICPPSLSHIKITSVYIYANTWQAADAPFSTLCYNKKQKKKRRASLEPEHIWVYSHWPDPDVGRRALQAKTHLDAYSSKTKGKGENSPPAPDYLFSSNLSLICLFSSTKFKSAHGIVMSMYGGHCHLRIECVKLAYSWANSITEEEKKGVWKSHKWLSPSNPPWLPMLNPPWCTGALSEPLRPTLAPRAHTHTAIQMLWVINLPLWASECVKVWETDFVHAIESVPL